MRAYYVDGRFAEVEAALSPLLSAQPENPAFLAESATIKPALDDLTGAERAASRANEVAPDSIVALITLADIRRRQKRYQEALTLLDSGLELSPDTTELDHVAWSRPAQER
jgi:predicted Zn-dependent protease